MKTTEQTIQPATEIEEDPLTLLLDELGRPPAPRRTAWAYRLSLVLVTFFVVALPLVYVAIVAATGWGVVWYVLHTPEFVEGINSGRGKALVVGGPPVIGGVLFFFLLKPLLARRQRRAEPHVLIPEKDPEIHELVGRLSQALEAPCPERIEVDLRVNAAASFAHGFGSLFNGKTALTIGLPLVSALSLKEFTAVLAHEFGHFSQGAGMRFYYLTASVNHWFARVVFERDQWDERLRQWSEDNTLMGAIILLIARGGVWLSRGFLFVLMKLGMWASSLMSRQMEFDADQNAVRLCGTDAFVRSMELLPQIDAASQWAGAVNGQTMSHGHLADDFPALVCLGLGRMEEEVRLRIVEESMDSAVDMYASHPPTGERIRRARMQDQGGVFTADGPATALFVDYAELCCELTSDAFQASLGRQFDPSLLVSPSKALEASEGLQEAMAKANEFLLGVGIGPRTLDFESVPGATKSSKESFDALKKARRGALQHVRAARAAMEEEEDCEERLAAATAARLLLRVHLPVLDPSMARVTSTARAGRVAQEARSASERCFGDLLPFGSTMRTRIEQTLSLLHGDQVRDRVEDPQALLDRGKRAVQAMIDMRLPGEEMKGLARSLGVVHRVAAQLEGASKEQVDELLPILMKSLRKGMVQARSKLSGLEHPYRDFGREQDLARILFPTLPRRNDGLEAYADLAASALNGWSAVVGEVQCELADVCLQAETAMNLKSLEGATSHR